MGFCFDINGSHQLLVSSHLRERDKMLLRAILSGGVWNGVLLRQGQKKRTFPAGFAVLLIMMATPLLGMHFSPFCGTS